MSGLKNVGGIEALCFDRPGRPQRVPRGHGWGSRSVRIGRRGGLGSADCDHQQMKSTSNVLILGASVAGMVLFLQGLRVVDTVGVLVCGVVAGGARAAIAASRRHKP